jgi:hypothetical protein
VLGESGVRKSKKERESDEESKAESESRLRERRQLSRSVVFVLAALRCSLPVQHPLTRILSTRRPPPALPVFPLSSSRLSFNNSHETTFRRAGKRR